jgi:hypothetical protein
MKEVNQQEAHVHGMYDVLEKHMTEDQKNLSTESLLDYSEWIEKNYKK